METFRFVLRTCVLLMAILTMVQATALESSALKAHNEYRAIHGTPPLAMDEKASQFAEQYAQHLVSIDRLEHSPRGQYGENLYFYSVWGSALPDDETVARMAVKSWYDEIKKYNFNNPGFKSGTGHFTQVVWKSSKLLGIGVARNSGGTKVYVVAEYSPPGNVANPGYFAENVPKGSSKAGQRSGIAESGSTSIQLKFTATTMLALCANSFLV